MSEREDAIAKIKALRAKAGDAAATEAEVEAAAMMAAKLLSKHDIEESELADVQNSGAREGSANNTKVLPEVLHHVWFGIQKLTETKAYIQNGSQLRYIGTPYDVEMALYLAEMIVGASKRMWVDYADGKPLPYKEMLMMRNGFMSGFGGRVNERLVELALERQKEREAKVSHSSALVVVKQDLIKGWLKENGLVLRKGKRHTTGPVDTRAFSEGRSAGDRVNLNRPVEGGQRYEQLV